MPNGVDKNLTRLTMAIAAYRRRFGRWPTHARFAPIILWDLAQILDQRNFSRLADLMELRTQRDGISVGGAPGVQEYGGAAFETNEEDAEAAGQWLGVEVRPDLEHY